MKTKIYKALSILLTLCMIFSACICAIGTVSAAQTATYYVGADGTSLPDDAPKDATLYTSVEAAITAANAAGLVAGDTAEVIVLSATNWTATDVNTTPTHAFQLNVISEADTPVTVTAVSTSHNQLKLGGDTLFRNVTLAFTKAYQSLYCEGYDVTFDINSKVSGSYIYFDTGVTGGEINGQNIVFNSNFGTFANKLAPDSGAVKYTGPLNVVFNDSAISKTFYLGNTYYATTFDANLNIEIKKATKVILAPETTSNTKPYVFGENSAFQIINECGATVDYSAISAYTTYFPSDRYYVISNATGKEDVIDFTETNGKFKVSLDSTKYEIVVQDISGNDVTANSSVTALEGGVGYTFTAPEAGQYSVKIAKVPQNVTYYVGTDSTGLPEGTTLYATVDEAIVAANAAGYVEGDTVTVKVVGTDAVNWKLVDSALDKSTTAHGFKLIVDSNTETQASVTMLNATTLGGNTEFGNVKVTYSNSNAEPVLNLNGYNAVFNSASNVFARYVFLGTSGTAAKRSLYIGSTTPNHYQVKLANDGSGVTYTGDIDITVDNAAATPVFTMAGNYSASTYQNIYLNVKSAASVAFKYTISTNKNLNQNSPTVNGVINIINSSGAILGADDNDLALVDDSKKWIITNKSGRKELLSFTNTAGVYTINTDYLDLEEGETVRVYKDGELVIENATSSIDLTTTALGENGGAGEYTVKVYRDPKAWDYYVSADGSDETGDGSKETPYATIEKVIAVANSVGAMEGDTVKAYVTSGATVEYGSPEAYTYSLELVSDGTATVHIADRANFTGDIKFNGIILNCNDNSANEDTIAFAGFDVEFTSNSKITNINNIFTANCSADAVYAGGQNIKIDCPNSALYLYVSGDWKTASYGGDVNITITSSWVPTMYMGVHTTVTYNGAVNINAYNGVKFANTNYAVYKNGINIVSENALADASYTYLNALASSETNPVAVYTLYNATETKGILGLGNTGGKFTVNSTEQLTAISVANGDSAELVDGVIDVTTLGTGHYYLAKPYVYNGEETEYAEYIDYCTALNGNDALNNFAAKLNSKEHVNVVYYGGSVTNGTGASVADSTSWRGIISNWLKVNFPKSTVTNINSAIGGTGSFFGTYRLEEAVLDKEPDLLFIEFSINDYYDNQIDWNVGETEAARRFESIVNRVRKELPNCDIVTVLTGEVGTMDALINNDQLHAQARGHKAISEAYGIPVLRVAHALADQLVKDDPDWTLALYSSQLGTYKTEVAAGTRTEGDYTDLPELAAWRNYVTDIVHCADNGYRVYANVVQEFLANSLMSDSAKSITEIKAHTIPEKIVSEALIDGGIEFIPCDTALAEESASLGGYEFTAVNDGNLKYFETRFNISDTTQVLKFKFTGTELSILDNSYSTAFKGVNVRIDGGETYYVPFHSVKPTILASGLEYTEHTAEISVAEKRDGGNHWVYGFYTRNENESTHTHVYQNYLEEEPATCQDNATEIGKCKYCNDTDEREVPNSTVDHLYTDYTPNGDATCQKNATEIAYCDYECGTPDYQEIPNTKVGHSFTNYTAYEPASCEKNATEIAYCDYECGTSDIRDIENTKLAHDAEYRAETKTTPCQSPGVKAHWFCEGCTSYFTDEACTNEVEYDTLLKLDEMTYEHNYDNEVDKDCNWCFAEREITGKALVKGEDGVWYYYVDGEKSNDRTLVKKGNVWFFVENGVWNKTATTLVKYEGIWFYVENGRWNKTATTLVKYEGIWFYVENGRWNKTARTLVKYEGIWFYVENGRWNKTARTLVKYEGIWFFVNNGRWDKTSETVVKYNNVWFYVNGGRWVTDAETLVKYSGNWLYIKNGRWSNTANTYFTYKNVKFKIVNGVAQV